MRIRVLGVITLLLISFTLATCSPNSSGDRTSTSNPPTVASPDVVIQSPSTIATPSPSKRREDCLVKVFTSQTTELTCAKVYGFGKGGISIAGKVVDQKEALLFPDEKMQTTTSMAELVFDTLDMVKASKRSTFNFEQGLRVEELRPEELKRLGLEPGKGHFPLDLGKILISDISHGRSDLGSSGSSQVGSDSNTLVLGTSTGEMDIASIGAVYVVQRDKQQQRTQVFNLSRGAIKVADNKKTVRTLGEYQTVAATKDGFDGEPFEFALCSFYRENESLLEGLRPGEEEFIKGKPQILQLAYDTARSKALPSYHDLCQRRCPIRSVY